MTQYNFSDKDLKTLKSLVAGQEGNSHANKILQHIKNINQETESPLNPSYIGNIANEAEYLKREISKIAPEDKRVLADIIALSTKMLNDLLKIPYFQRAMHVNAFLIKSNDKIIAMEILQQASHVVQQSLKQLAHVNDDRHITPAKKSFSIFDLFRRSNKVMDSSQIKLIRVPLSEIEAVKEFLEQLHGSLNLEIKKSQPDASIINQIQTKVEKFIDNLPHGFSPILYNNLSQLNSELINCRIITNEEAAVVEKPVTPLLVKLLGECTKPYQGSMIKQHGNIEQLFQNIQILCMSMSHEQYNIFDDKLKKSVELLSVELANDIPLAGPDRDNLDSTDTAPVHSTTRPDSR